MTLGTVVHRKVELTELSDNQIEDALRIALSHLENLKGDYSVGVLLTNDEEIRALNSKYRSKDAPTNILAFPTLDYMKNRPSECPLGDLILSQDRVKEEAVDQGKSVKSHATHLLIHGFLHLVGYDHVKDEDATKMEGMEIKILKEIGISNPYV